MDNYEFEKRLSDLESNQLVLGTELEHLKRPIRAKISDWIRGKLGKEPKKPAALALWITVPRERPLDDDPPPFKIFAVKGTTK